MAILKNLTVNGNGLISQNLDVTQNLTVNQNLSFGSLTVNGPIDMDNNELQNTVLSGYTEEYVTIAGSGAACTLNCESSNMFHVTITDSCNITFTNLPDFFVPGRKVMLLLGAWSAQLA